MTMNTLVHPEISRFAYDRMARDKIVQRIIWGIYLSAGFSGLITLISIWYLQPMYQQVLHARLGLYGGVKSLITTFNKKLSARVVVYPEKRRVIHGLNCQNAATQTLSESVNQRQDTATSQVERISYLSGKTKELAEMTVDSSMLDISQGISALEQYIESMAYPYMSEGMHANPDQSKSKLISQVQGEIRSLKGSILNV